MGPAKPHTIQASNKPRAPPINPDRSKATIDGQRPPSTVKGHHRRSEATINGQRPPSIPNWPVLTPRHVPFYTPQHPIHIHLQSLLAYVHQTSFGSSLPIPFLCPSSPLSCTYPLMCPASFSRPPPLSVTALSLGVHLIVLTLAFSHDHSCSSQPLATDSQTQPDFGAGLITQVSLARVAQLAALGCDQTRSNLHVCPLEARACMQVCINTCPCDGKRECTECGAHTYEHTSTHECACRWAWPVAPRRPRRPRSRPCTRSKPARIQQPCSMVHTTLPWVHSRQV